MDRISWRSYRPRRSCRQYRRMRSEDRYRNKLEGRIKRRKKMMIQNLEKNPTSIFIDSGAGESACLAEAFPDYKVYHTDKVGNLYRATGGQELRNVREFIIPSSQLRAPTTVVEKVCIQSASLTFTGQHKDYWNWAVYLRLDCNVAQQQERRPSKSLFDHILQNRGKYPRTLIGKCRWRITGPMGRSETNVCCRHQNLITC